MTWLKYMGTHSLIQKEMCTRGDSRPLAQCRKSCVYFMTSLQIWQEKKGQTIPENDSLNYRKTRKQNTPDMRHARHLTPVDGTLTSSLSSDVSIFCFTLLSQTFELNWLANYRNLLAFSSITLVSGPVCDIEGKYNSL